MVDKPGFGRKDSSRELLDEGRGYSRDGIKKVRNEFLPLVAMCSGSMKRLQRSNRPRNSLKKPEAAHVVFFSRARASWPGAPAWSSSAALGA